MRQGEPQASLRAMRNDHAELWNRSSLALKSSPAACTAGTGAIFAPENPIFQSKNRFFTVSAPENPQDFSGN